MVHRNLECTDKIEKLISVGIERTTCTMCWAWCLHNIYSCFNHVLDWFSYDYLSLFQFHHSDDMATNHWMRLAPDDWLVSQLSIPGTHQSACRRGALNFGQYVPVASDVYESFAEDFAACQEQDWDIERQLNEGIRFLDFRVGEQGHLYHGRLPIKDHIDLAIRTCIDFLQKNRSECILASFKWEQETPNGVKYPEQQGTSEWMVARLKERHGKDNFWFERKCSGFEDGSFWRSWKGRIPTLREARGRIIFLSRYEYDTTRWDGIRFEYQKDDRLEGTNDNTRYRIQDKFDLTEYMRPSDMLGVGSVLDTSTTDPRRRKFEDWVKPFIYKADKQPAVENHVLYFNFLSGYAGTPPNS